MGIGIRDQNNLNNYNPASYTSIQGATQIFELGFYTQSNYYENSEESENFNTGNLTGINGWFRFSKKWAGVVGISPFSNVDYNISSSRKIGIDNSSSVAYSGNGGISQFYFGNAFQLIRNLSIGVDASYLFGSIEKNETVTDGLGAGTVLKNRIHVSRLKADLGAQYTFFLKNDKSLNFGVTYNPALRLNTSGKKMLIRPMEGDTLSSDVKVDDYDLPLSYGAGISYQTKRSTFAFDYSYSAWSDAAFDDNNLKLQNTSRYAIGYSYEGNPDAERYIDAVKVRAGYHFQNSYIVLKNTSFNEWGFSAGIGLPLVGNRGSLNLSYHYNHFGTLQNDLIRQQSNTIVLDIVFRDLWGIRRKFD